MATHRKAARAGSRKRSVRSRARIKRAPSKPSSSRTRPLTPARANKKGTILALLQRSHGAAIDDLTAATGWQTHSIRAALTGLRKEGRELHRDKDHAGGTRYRIIADS
jgi:uncharacterized protein DUF3489